MEVSFFPLVIPAFLSELLQLQFLHFQLNLQGFLPPLKALVIIVVDIVCLDPLPCLVTSKPYRQIVIGFNSTLAHKRPIIYVL